MAHEKFRAEVLTPEGEVFNDEVEMVTTRTGTGAIGIRSKHTPLLAMLDPAELRLYTGENDYKVFAQAEGYLQVANNRVLVLVEEAIDPDDLDSSELSDRISTAEKEAEDAEDGSEAEKRAQRDRVRWEVFQKIAEGAHPGHPGGKTA